MAQKIEGRRVLSAPKNSCVAMKTSPRNFVTCGLVGGCRRKEKSCGQHSTALCAVSMSVMYMVCLT